MTIIIFSQDKIVFGAGIRSVLPDRFRMKEIEKVDKSGV